MPKYEVTIEAIIYAPVRIIVEADSKEDADDKATSTMPINASEAGRGGWKASVTFKPPKGVELASTLATSTALQSTSGVKGNRIKRLQE